MSEHDKWESLSGLTDGKIKAIKIDIDQRVAMPFQLKMEHTVHLDFCDVEFVDDGDSGLDIILTPTHGNVKTRLKVNRPTLKAVLEKILE